MGDGQSKVITRTLEMYLCCFTSSNPMEWLKWFTWVDLGCVLLQYVGIPLFQVLLLKLFMEDYHPNY